jgi:hypothetical protein
MENTSCLVGSYYTHASLGIQSPALGQCGVVLIIAEELTTIQSARIDAALRSYAGIAL